MLKALRDNLALLSLLVVLVGVSSTDAYYAMFGLKYQLIALSSSHILYRGLTSVFSSIPIALLYVTALLAIIGQGYLAIVIRSLDRLRVLNYILVVAFAVLAWTAGRAAGVDAAIADSTSQISSLPVVERLSVRPDSSAPSIEGSLQGYRMLLQTGEGAFLVHLVNDPTKEVPIVQFIPGSAIEQIRFCTRC